MDAWILPTIMNVVLGIIAWLGKMAIDEVKNQLKDAKQQIASHEKDIQKVREEYLNKNDFREFRNELYDRMDRNHADIVRQITGSK